MHDGESRGQIGPGWTYAWVISPGREREGRPRNKIRRDLRVEKGQRINGSRSSWLPQSRGRRGSEAVALCVDVHERALNLATTHDGHCFGVGITSQFPSPSPALLPLPPIFSSGHSKNYAIALRDPYSRQICTSPIF